jgi:acetamidase/formamidase
LLSRAFPCGRGGAEIPESHPSSELYSERAIASDGNRPILFSVGTLRYHEGLGAVAKLANAAVCKTAIHRFESDPRLHPPAKLSGCYRGSMNRLPCVLALFTFCCSFAIGETHRLAASPQTVVIGYYSASAKPVLTIHSGDTVVVETVSGNPESLERMGLPAGEVPEALRAITTQVKDRGPGGHILTGPIYVDGAEPGDVLELHIEAIQIPAPWAYNSFRPTAGFLQEDFPHPASKLIRLDRERMMGLFAPGIEVPLRPFFGSMGVAPPPDAGRINSAPPWMHAGNLDNKELIAGTTLYIPIHARGALFEVGDGHAGQGNGEVDITAMETALTGTFRFVVRKNLHLKWPRAETPTHYIVMGMEEELVVATKQAVREMIDFLVTQKGLSREDAYMLTSVAADFSITQLVDGKKGVHGMIAKSIFTAK